MRVWDGLDIALRIMKYLGRLLTESIIVSMSKINLRLEEDIKGRKESMD